MKIAWSILVITASLAAFAQSDSSQPNVAADPPFTLTIGFSSNPNLENPPDHVVASSGAISPWIRKTNITDHDIIKRSPTGGFYGYHLDVRDSDGNPVGPRPPKDMSFRGDDKGGILLGGKNNLLQPGQSLIDMLSVARWFDMRKPGDYTIQAWAHVSDDPKSDVVKSNILTVTVASTPENDEPK